MAQFNVKGDFKHKKVQMNCDQVLHPKLMKPLSSIRSGSLIVIAGSSGSGKTNMLCNLFNCHKDPVTGEKRDLMMCFHNIFIVSPSMNSFTKGNKFDSLPDSHKYEDLHNFMENFEDGIEDETDQNVVIFDDIGNEIRTKQNLTAFKSFIDNRRHAKMTVILLLQSLVQIPPAIRASVNMIIAFKPKSVNEKEMLFDLTGLHRKNLFNFYRQLFTEKYDSVCVDLTLTNSPNYVFYKNLFNEVEITGGGEEV